MGEVIYGDIKQYIDELAKSLGVAAEHVYELLVRQQVIDGIITLVGILVLIALLGTVFLIAINRDSFRGDAITVSWAVGTVSGMILLLVVVGGIFEAPTAVKQLINPEYYAIKEIMDVFKGGQ